MATIFSSRRALEILAALEQRDGGLRLSEVAKAIGAPASSAEVGLGVLKDDRLAAASSDRPPRYRIAAGAAEDAAKLLDVAARRVDGEQLLVAALRANRAVEFAAQDEAGLLLVIRWDAEPADEVALNRMLERVDLEVTRFDHDGLRERLRDDRHRDDRHRDDRSLRERAEHARVLTGTVDRSFPDPFAHGAPDAPPLGRRHPTIARPSQRTIARIARRFGLSEVRVFGSAVHADFRPDSDIDVMVRRRRGVRRTLEDELSLRRALEDLLGRDVDVVDASVLRAPIRERAEADGVVLYG